jgi:hypothetical protein
MVKSPLFQVVGLYKEEAVAYIYFIGGVKYYKYIPNIYKEVPKTYKQIPERCN